MVRPAPPREEVKGDEYQHQGYRVLLDCKGKEWRVEIYRPGTTTCHLVINYAGASADRDLVVDDVKQIIDQLLKIDTGKGTGTSRFS